MYTLSRTTLHYCLVIALLGWPKAQADNVVFVTDEISGPWQAIVDTEILKITGDVSSGVRLYREDLSFVSATEAFDTARWVSAFNQRYKNLDIDRVIGTGAFTTSLLKSHADEILPEVSKYLVSDTEVALINVEQNRSETLSKRDIVTPIPGLAKSLFPGTSKIILISTFGDRFDWMSLLDNSDLSISVELWDQRMSFDEVLAASEMLREDTILFYAGMFVDSNGENRTPASFAEQLSDKTSRPIFISYATFLDKGTLGGLVIDPVNTGQVVGALALGDYSTDLSPVSLTFDYRVMDRFGIDLKSLPSEAKVINRPIAFMQDTERQRNFALGFITVLGVIVAMLGSAYASRARALKKIRAADKRAEKARKETETYAARFSSLFDQAQVGFVLVDELSIMVDVNQALENILAMSADTEPKGQVFAYFNAIEAEPLYLSWWQTGCEKPLKLKIQEAPERWVQIKRVPLNDPETPYLLAFDDITFEHIQARSLEDSAFKDPLTGLPNRRLLSDRLEQLMNRCARSGERIQVLFIDLDGFKAINDQHGHQFGDQVLKHVARQLTTSVREWDTVARLGGDEFVVILDKIDGLEDASLIYRRIIDAIEAEYTLDSFKLTVGCSIGIAEYPQKTDINAAQLVRQADRAMYDAKLQGRGGYQFADPDHDDLLSAQAKLIYEFDYAIEHSQLELYYQPKINLSDWSLEGYEALIRWRHPERGLLTPGNFLPHLENTVIIEKLGRWVAESAVAYLDLSAKQGRRETVSINVTGRNIMDDSFLQLVERLFESHPTVAPSQLEFEILETSELGNDVGLSDRLSRFEELGIRFSLDDFGTAFSSLSYIKRLPVEALKIDLSFVRDMFRDPNDLGVISGILSLAKAFQFSTVAEGVETDQQLLLLQLLGCTSAQGYLIAKPMPVDQLDYWYSNFKERMSGLPECILSQDERSLLVAIVQHQIWVSKLGENPNSVDLGGQSYQQHHRHLEHWLTDEHNKSNRSKVMLVRLQSRYSQFRSHCTGIEKSPLNGNVQDFDVLKEASMKLRSLVAEALESQNDSPGFRTKLAPCPIRTILLCD
ncbi:MAG: EAL domain-containing protein [Oceanospirillales bacterium]|nr:EAL domain-containing protein [Oceanospirillales bacterium]MBR9888292.1 EAL domain-containing protein [Oceanospirillales bacterium]